MTKPIYLLGTSQKELHTIAMRKRLGWVLFLIVIGISTYGWYVFWVRNI